jgi:hypothetical protein
MNGAYYKYFQADQSVIVDNLFRELEDMSLIIPLKSTANYHLEKPKNFFSYFTVNTLSAFITNIFLIYGSTL